MLVVHEIQHDDVQQSRMQPSSTADLEIGQEVCQPSAVAAIAEVQLFEKQAEEDHGLQHNSTADLEIGQEVCQPSAVAAIAEVQLFEKQALGEIGHEDCEPRGCALVPGVCRLVNYSSSDEDSYVCPSVSDDDDIGSPVIPQIERFAAVQFRMKEADRDVYDFSDADNRPESVSATGVEEEDFSDADDADIQPESMSSTPVEKEDKSARVIRIYSKCAHGQGKDRRLPCYFCDKFVFHMPRHLKALHASEFQVAAVLARVESAKLLGLKQLTNMGVYKHNCNVLKNGDGVLIVGRSPRKAARSPEDFLPCTFCLAFYVKRELYRHCSKCKFRLDDASVNSFIASGRALLLGSITDDDSVDLAELNEHVVPRMRLDRRTSVAVGDSLIMKYGAMLLHKLGRKRVLDVSARMRELARLLIRLQHNNNGQVHLDDFLDRNGFDKVVEAVQAEGRSFVHDSGRRLYKSPAFVLKVGNSLLKCAQLKRGSALRNGDDVAMKEAADFIMLHTTEFTDNVTSLAHASLRIKGNSLSEFPDEEDLRTLKQFQESQMSSLLGQLRDHPDPCLWRELAELTLSRLLVFNGRRGSEGSELTVTEYSNATSDVDRAFLAGFTDVERQLLTR